MFYYCYVLFILIMYVCVFLLLCFMYSYYVCLCILIVMFYVFLLCMFVYSYFFPPNAPTCPLRTSWSSLLGMAEV